MTASDRAALRKPVATPRLSHLYVETEPKQPQSVRSKLFTLVCGMVIGASCTLAAIGSTLENF
jgi:hypothetical protein